MRKCAVESIHARVSRAARGGSHVPDLERRCICVLVLETPSVAEAFMVVVLAFAVFVVAILTELTGALAGVLRMLGGRVDICMATRVGYPSWSGALFFGAASTGPCTRPLADLKLGNWKGLA